MYLTRAIHFFTFNSNVSSGPRINTVSVKKAVRLMSPLLHKKEKTREMPCLCLVPGAVCTKAKSICGLLEPVFLTFKEA
jgi:hypothetical protein